MLRLNKYLAAAGLGSRRAVEQLIIDGQVKINGKVATQLATLVDEKKDRVEVGGEPTQAARSFSYYMMNKPRGYDVTRGGRHHHRRAYDLLPEGVHASVQAVGRLDRDSTGLLLFTNDGDLAFRLMHPRHGCNKVYEVEVEGRPDGLKLERLAKGVELEDGPAAAVRVERMPDGEDGQSRLRITMAEGRKHIVRRMCEAVGHPVTALNRSNVGPLHIGTLRRGKVRPLRPREVKALRESVELNEDTGERNISRPTRSGPPRPKIGQARPQRGRAEVPRWDRRDIANNEKPRWESRGPAEPSAKPAGRRPPSARPRPLREMQDDSNKPARPKIVKPPPRPASKFHK